MAILIVHVFVNNVKWKKNCKIICHTVITHFCFVKSIMRILNCNSGVMANMLTSSAIDHGLKPWLRQTKDNKIDICCISAEHTALREHILIGS